MILLWSVLACSPKQANKPVDNVQTEKATAPLELVRRPVAKGSVLEITTTGGVDALIVEVWGANGLVLPADELRVDLGKLAIGTTTSVDVEHTGEGDLAVRFVGTFSGVQGDDVRSFVIGTPEAVDVPEHATEGRKTKGWDATRR